MHILGLMLAVLAGAGFWWWRVKAAGEAASEAADFAGRLWGNYKRKKFLNKVNDSPLAVIDDPATAAVILMFAIQKEDGILGPEAEAQVRHEVQTSMGIAEPTEILTFGKWTADQAPDANSIIQRFGDIWKQGLSTAERNDLVGMVTRISAGPVEAVLSTTQKARISRLRQRIGLPV